MFQLKRIAFGGLFLAGYALTASAQGPADLRAVFERLDANNDMTVEKSEVPESAQPAFEKLLKAADSNGDGKIQADEIRGVMQNFRPNAAQMRERFAAMDADKDGKISKAEFKGPEDAFPRLDADGDGFLTRQEMLRAAGGAEAGPAGMPMLSQMIERLKAMDADKDGKITKAEFKGREEGFARLDANKDGVITTDEMPKLPPGGAMAAAGLPPRLKNLDKNDDGKLDKDELRLPEQMFARADADGDGKLSAQEAFGLMQVFLTRVRQMDSDGDGKVTKAEYQGPAVLFEHLDVNKDGAISKEDAPTGPAGPPGPAARTKAAAKKAAAKKKAE